jgi:pimeloyl-ACP methyl ester carboxylesterase
VNRLAEAWRARGRHRTLCGEQVFVVDVPCTGEAVAAPLLVLHGFPTSSFDFHRVVDALARTRRVVLFDYPGFGLSSKADRAYSLVGQADVAQALVDSLGIDRLGLLTHDIGDTVGGELLARQLDGAWPVEVTDRILTNGTLFMDLVVLSAGQQLLEALPDERLAEGVLERDGVLAGLTATYGPVAVVDPEELEAAWELISRDEGHRLLARLARYIDERRRLEGRFTPPVLAHPSPLTVVWGTDDPIAVPAMADRVGGLRPDATVVRLDGVGHYPMVEAPGRFLEALGIPAAR